jgi:hypothetical protein
VWMPGSPPVPQLLASVETTLLIRIGLALPT